MNMKNKSTGRGVYDSLCEYAKVTVDIGGNNVHGIVLTQSSMRAFMSCPRKFKLGYIDWIRRAKSESETHEEDALRLGSIFHRGLECLYIGKIKSVAGMEEFCASLLSKYENAIDDNSSNEEFMCNAITTAKACGMLMAYCEHMLQFVTSISNVTVEVPFCYESEQDGVFLAGKIDAIASMPSPAMSNTIPGFILPGNIIIEHKTAGAGAVGYSYIARLELDIQLAMYAMAYMNLSNSIVRTTNSCDGVSIVYDISEKPAARYRRTESEHDFQERLAKLMAKNKSGKSTAQRQLGETLSMYACRVRGAMLERDEPVTIVQIEFSDNKLVQSRSVLNSIVKQIIMAISSKNFPMYTGNCHSGFGLCPFFDLCKAELRGERDGQIVRQTMYEKTQPVPELTSDEA